nr:hypothetical protein GTC16762_23110 [Pigmentibacter ruber]
MGKKDNKMLFFLQRISAKNKLWIATIIHILVCASLSIGIIYFDKFTGNNLYIAISIVCFITLIFIILSKYLLYKFVKSIKNGLTYTSTHCVQGDQQLNDLKNNLSQFISVTGSELDELTTNAKLMQDIALMFVETTRNSEVCKEMSDKVTRDVNEGNEIMEKMVESILTIEKAKDGLSEISNLIQQISNDTSTIHTIVSTTELLSLNASIEAAKAGQTGKGFSVVAEEVGNLAKHSGVEANEIENIVVKSQKQIQEIIQANQSRVEVGKVSSNNALTLFSEIKKEMFGISSRSENIRAATWEQKVGLDHMTESNVEIRNILKKNITDTVNLIRIHDVNYKNFQNIKEVAKVLSEYWTGEKVNEN